MQISTAEVTPKKAESDLLPLLIVQALADGNSLALWRMPNSNEKHLLVSEGPQTLEDISLEESPTGFVFSPFDNSKGKLFFKGTAIHSFKDGLYEGNLFSDHLPSSKMRSGIKSKEEGKFYFTKKLKDTRTPSGFLQLVSKSIDEIKKGLFEKVVPSRSKIVGLTQDFDVVKTFQTLCVNYPNTLVTLVTSPETGTWLGATPELLVSIDDQSRFKTVALAGTQRYNPSMDVKSVAWTEKDIEEQAMVSRYIINCFKKIRLREFEERGPRTAIAGNLLHLKTEYEVDMKATNFPLLGSVMLRLLHPTSAVCGMPLNSTQEFLKSNEGYDREYYSGYLGPVNFKNESHIFVNLRCMQLHGKEATLYAGAGVTIDSNPEKELEETEMKMDTLQKILN